MTKGQKYLVEWWDGLKRWEKEYFYYSSKINRMLLWQWKTGKVRPSLAKARELEKFSKRKVPMTSWLEEIKEEDDGNGQRR